VRAAGKVQADLIIVYTATGALQMFIMFELLSDHGDTSCLTSPAVRAAGKVQADLIIVYTATGRWTIRMY
jgi:mRNA-degrading endonuclease YafQ of YafQ-DinJ toxin-antitoxin module